MRRNFRIAVFMALLPLITALAGAPAWAAGSFRVEVWRHTNQARHAAGLGAVTLDGLLSRIAQSFAKDMVDRNYFSHQSPEGHDLGWRLRPVDYTSLAGENIAWGFYSAGAVVDGWMKSDGHRRNILQPRFTKMGVGRDDRTWVQIFTD